ncbi:MAG: DUF402 domain-containing protein [Nocardiopsaceae bacterium]|jgi:hypothetical protein|nr:DUF402 domain-containing protein [Nocardiopsaceae bacterium]
MTAGPVRDFDFHPDEDGVRVFVTEPAGVLRIDSDAYVSAGRYSDLILWHYAFTRHWFKINLTTDLDGRTVETGDDEPGRGFAFNCDIATPMRIQDNAVYAVDLFADVLVRADGVTYRVTDLEEFRQAQDRELILPGEARGAREGLAELTGIIERGELASFLRQACPPGRLNPPFASAADRVPLTQVPLLSEGNRADWAERQRMRQGVPTSGSHPQ